MPKSSIQKEDATKGVDMLAENSIYQFQVKDIFGIDRSLADYTGKVLLIVNTASKCGFTYQYRDLESLYEKYKDKGFVILGFPANNFMHQEPGTNEEILNFCQTSYNVTFPLFDKISVRGSKIHPLYKYLTQKATNPKFSGKISWNFNKFLISKEGEILARFGSPVDPMDESVTSQIEEALK
jgi:glutathione peroxidase